jgi:hypothetical protein
MVCITHQKGNQIKEEEMDRTCRMHGREQKCVWDLVGKPDAKDHLEDLGIDGRTILQWVLRKETGRTYTQLIWLMESVIHLVSELRNESKVLDTTAQHTF